MRTVTGLRAIVENALAYDPTIVDQGIGVAVHGGVVTLSGHVPSYQDMNEAEKVVKQLRGVKAVANDLEVDLPGSSRRSDTDIAAAAVIALEGESEVPEDEIKILVHSGWITLQGNLDSQQQKRAAERAVRYLAGVRGVSNALQVKPAIAPSPVTARIRQALERSARLDANQIRIEAEGRTVTLRGSRHSWTEHNPDEEAAWAAGVWTIEDPGHIDSRSRRRRT